MVIWVNTYGQSRVFNTTLGHANATVSQGLYLDLITRGMLWACGRLEKPDRFRITEAQRAQ